MFTIAHPAAGVVSSVHPLASQTGVDVMAAGGNAADATVAIAAALNVLDPSNTGMGGDMFALVYWAETGEVRALNGSGRAPAAATIDLYRSEGYDEMPDFGPLSISAPAAALGWQAVHDAYGSRPWADVLRPAIGYARDGHPVSAVTSIQMGEAAKRLAQSPYAKAVYLHGDDGYYRMGETLVQADLADSLQALAEGGAAALHGGDLGRRYCAGLQAQGGLVTEDDLAAQEAHWTTPLRTTYRRHEVCVMPPNSHGLTLLVMLNILEPEDVAALGRDTVQRVHLQVEAKKLAFAVRGKYVGDPEQLSVDPAELCTPAYAEKLRARLGRARADTRTAPVPEPYEGDDTTYFCVADAQGNRVSFINSLFESFGSGVVAGDTGIVCPNRCASFRLDPTALNALAPGRRPMHTLMPTLVLRDGRPRFTLGCIGGHQQPQGLLQILQHLLDDGDDVKQAVLAPRFRSYKRNRLAVEAALAGLTEPLSAMGHDVRNEGFQFFGGCQILEDRPDGSIHAFSDPRLGGEVRGA